MSTQVQTAIQQALDCLWEEAIETNLLILENNPLDLNTLNRLGKAYAAIGDKEAAKKTYQQALKIDKYNSVALRNLKLLAITGSNVPTTDLVQEDFIEVPGLTKTVDLIKPADKKILLSLCCKQILTLSPKAHLVSIQTANKATIGCLPDDLSMKLKKLLKSGYQYQVCLKNATDKNVSVFIRELKRPNKKTALPSFSRTHLSK